MIQIKCPQNYTATVETKSKNLVLKKLGVTILNEIIVKKDNRMSLKTTAQLYVEDFILNIQTNEELIITVLKAFKNKEISAVDQGIEAIDVLKKRLEHMV